MTFLSYKQAKNNPCENCTAGCCTYLPLKDILITNIMVLDHLYYLLHFEGIELLLVDGNIWRVHYSNKCTFLTESNLCSLHNTPEKPNICKTYNPYNCFYKPAFDKTEAPNYVRINLERLEFISNYMEFDDDRNIAKLPDISEIFHLLPPYQKKSLPNKATFPEQKDVEHNLTVERVKQPCSNCESYCCNTLYFEMEAPRHISNLDYFRFCTGYPNVFVTLHEGQWYVTIKSTCKNYDPSSEFRCKVFGKDERPIHCSMYDEMKCEYIKRFVPSATSPNVVLQNKHIATLEKMCTYDSLGNITYLPDAYSLQSLSQQNEYS